MTGCNPPPGKISGIQSEIDSIAGIYIPDKRMGICDIKVTQGDGGALILTGESTDPQALMAVIKALSNRNKNLIDSVLILPDTTKCNRYYGLVTLSVINIRKDPGHDAEMVTQAVLGTPVLILKEDDGWLQLQTPDRYIGWAEMASVEPMTAEQIAEWKKSERMITLVNSGWIYTSPDESGVVGDIVSGSIVTKAGESKGYTKIRLPDGREGYINSKALIDFSKWKTEVKCSEESVVKYAASFTGLPYLWGGTSSKGVDCSGFSKTVYFLNGIILLRDASLQALHGADVDISDGYSNLRKGDLLFFGTKRNSKMRVTHVAIYIGDSEYINASGRVIVNSFDSTRSNYNDYRINLLLKAKRIIGVNDDPGIMPVSEHEWY
jgi:gamma-D-glutamyl-L-lysine dipeptidyl-peptidase